MLPCILVISDSTNPQLKFVEIAFLPWSRQDCRSPISHVRRIRRFNLSDNAPKKPFNNNIRSEVGLGVVHLFIDPWPAWYPFTLNIPALKQASLNSDKLTINKTEFICDEFWEVSLFNNKLGECTLDASLIFGDPHLHQNKETADYCYVSDNQFLSRILYRGSPKFKPQNMWFSEDSNRFWVKNLWHSPEKRVNPCFSLLSANQRFIRYVLVRIPHLVIELSRVLEVI